MRSLLLAVGILAIQTAFLLLLFAEGRHRWITAPLLLLAGAGFAWLSGRRRTPKAAAGRASVRA